MQLDLLNVCAGSDGLVARNRVPRVRPHLEGVRRVRLDETSWIDHKPHWLSAHSTLFDHLHRTTKWHDEVREMFDRWVRVPRRVAFLPSDGPGHPVLGEARAVLQQHYSDQLRCRVRFSGVGLGLYRDGRDSVAYHRDRGLRDRTESIIALISLGSPRAFHIRPLGGGSSKRFTAGWGDLLVMGGACQRDWEHAVPKCAYAEPRMSIQFRWSAER
ncbi:MAG: alpha-ketoglutarate-dependent dioxygenase AlkB [Myxococcota bacterium]|nr:alpha-ketoglutarate-dependent dioxygenase AlkB [Myxococcota bacterium]